MPLRMVLASALMIPASLVALVVMPPERAARNWATPSFRFCWALWMGEIAFLALLLLPDVWPDFRHLVGRLPEREIVSVLTGLTILCCLLWFTFGLVLVGEAWHWAWTRVRRFSARP